MEIYEDDKKRVCDSPKCDETLHEYTCRIADEGLFCGGMCLSTYYSLRKEERECQRCGDMFECHPTAKQETHQICPDERPE